MAFFTGFLYRHERLSETWNHFGGYFTDVTLDSVGRTIASRFKTDPILLIPVENCTYDIDGVHNRITVTTNGLPMAYTTNSINAYPTVGGIIRFHDANGNLTSDGTNQYIYNYRNDLIQVIRIADGFMLGTYKHDAFGRRTERTYWDAQVGAYRTLRYVYSGWQVIAEYDLVDQTERLFCNYVYGNGIDEPLNLEVLDVNDVDGDYITSEYLTYFYHRDTLGSITHMTDQNGAIVERYESTPYGKPYIYTSTGPDGLWNTLDDVQSPFSRIYNCYIFQARRLDCESDLYYFRTRHYSPAEGRFIQRDKPGDWFDPTNFGNGYNFVGSSVLSLIDPFGLHPESMAPQPVNHPSPDCDHTPSNIKVFDIHGNPQFAYDQSAINCLGHALGLDAAIGPINMSLGDLLRLCGWTPVEVSTPEEALDNCPDDCDVIIILYWEIPFYEGGEGSERDVGEFDWDKEGWPFAWLEYDAWTRIAPPYFPARWWRNGFWGGVGGYYGKNGDGSYKKDKNPEELAKADTPSPPVKNPQDNDQFYNDDCERRVVAAYRKRQ